MCSSLGGNRGLEIPFGPRCALLLCPLLNEVGVESKGGGDVLGPWTLLLPFRFRASS